MIDVVPDLADVHDVQSHSFKIDEIEVIVGFEKINKQDLCVGYTTPVAEFLRFNKNYSVYQYSSNTNSSKDKPKDIISMINLLGAVGLYVFFKSDDFYKVKDNDLIAAMNYAVSYLCPNYTIIGSAVLGEPDSTAGKAIQFISPFNNLNLELDFEKKLIENVILHFSDSEITKSIQGLESITDMRISDYYDFIVMYQVVLTSLITFFLVDIGYNISLKPTSRFSVVLEFNGVPEAASVDVERIKNCFLGLK